MSDIAEREIVEAIEFAKSRIDKKYSTHKLQRYLKIGLFRANMITKELEKQGIVSEYIQGKEREILI